MDDIKPYCCGQKMETTKLPVFSDFACFIGIITIILSILGIISVLYMFLSTGTTTNTSLGTVCGSLLGGLLGWFLSMKNNVFRCTKCGHIMDNW